MSAPFRDLFIELPRAVIETLQGIGEEAVRKEHHRQYAPQIEAPTMRAALRSPTVLRCLCERYGWESMEVSRSAECQTTRLWPWWPCGHRQLFELPDALLMAMGRAGIEGLLDDLDRQSEAGRRCYCVQRDSTP